MDLVGEERGEGRQQRRGLQQAVAQGREGGAVAVPEAAAREPHVPVGELLDELGDRLAGGGAVEVVHALADGLDGRLQPGERPAVEVVRSLSLSATATCDASEVGRAEALGVGVEDPEGVGVPEGEQELAHRLADRVDREAVARPGLLGGQVVPAEGVGAVGGDHVPGVDDVALALRHLLALGVEDQAEADAVAVAATCRRAGSTRRAACRTSRGSGRSPRRCSRRGSAPRTAPRSRTGSGTARRASRRCRTRCRSPTRPGASRRRTSRSRGRPRRCRGGAGRRGPRRGRARAARRPSRRRSGRRSPSPAHSQIGSGVPQ